MPHTLTTRPLRYSTADLDIIARDRVDDPPRFGFPATLWNGGVSPDANEETLTRKQWVTEEAGRQASKTVTELAEKNANLLWEAREGRGVRDRLAAGAVVIDKEDFSALTAYRELGSPADLKATAEAKAKLEGEQKKINWNAKRAELLGKYDGVDDKVAALIPTAEELEADGEASKLDRLDGLESQVKKVTAAWSLKAKAERENADVGASPADKTSGDALPVKSNATAEDAVNAYRNRHKPKQ